MAAAEFRASALQQELKAAEKEIKNLRNQLINTQINQSNEQRLQNDHKFALLEKDKDIYQLKVELGKKDKFSQDLLVDLQNERQETSNLHDRIKVLEN